MQLHYLSLLIQGEWIETVINWFFIVFPFYLSLLIQGEWIETDIENHNLIK